MTRIFWWLVNLSTRMLDAEECEVVCGDLVESGENCRQALRDVLGLVMRRQIALWWNLRPWLVLALLVVPFGVLLSFVSKRTSDLSAIYFWMYTNNWDWELLTQRGFWFAIIDWTPMVFLSYFALACWSWTTGFVVASLSRTIWVNRILFCLVVVFGQLLGVPRSLGKLPYLMSGREFYGNAAVFAVGFYRVVLPLIVVTALILIPAFRGMHQGRRLDAFPRMFRAILWLSMLVTLITLATLNPVWWRLLRIPGHPPRQAFAIIGPGMYILARIYTRARFRKTAFIAT